VAPRTRTVTEALADFAVEAAAALPEDVAHQTKRLLVHGLAATVDAAAHPLAVDISRWAGATAENGAAALPWTSRRAPRDVAALVIACQCELLGRTETYTPTYIHPTAGAAAGALVAADGRSVGGHELLAAIAVGVETAIAISHLLLPASHGRGFAPVPLLTPVAAATSYAVASGFDRERTMHAISLALSCSSGLFENVGTLAGLFAIGSGARTGVAAAEAAGAGVSGPTTVVEGRRGLIAALVGQAAEPPDAVLDQLGSRWRLNDLSYMRFPAETVVQAPLEAVLSLARHWPAEKRRAIRSLRLAISPHAADLAAERLVSYSPLRTEQQVKGDIRFCAAAAWLRGAFGSAERAAHDDPELLRLRESMVVVGDPAVGLYAAVAEVVAANGDRMASTIEGFAGSPERPLRDDELLVELHAAALAHVGEPRASALRELAWRVGTLDNAQPLLDAIACAPGREV
jgi:2-methylcitrate dehydratase PrpD